MNKTEKKHVDWNQIKMLIFDCDGVLTDGSIIYTNDMKEIKNFNAHDGMGFTLLHQAGLISGVITGRSSKALEQRCNDLGIKNLYQGIQKKLKTAHKLIEKYRLSWNQVVYMGDDWNDVPVMRLCAFSVCPADALPEIKLLADMVTDRSSGDGAARELIDYVLYQKNLYENTVLDYLNHVSS